MALTFSLKYLVNFCKASGLSGSVKLCLSNEVPLLVEYALSNNSYLRFYLAPKVCFKSAHGQECHANLNIRLVMRSKLRGIMNLSRMFHGVWRCLVAWDEQHGKLYTAREVNRLFMAVTSITGYVVQCVWAGAQDHKEGCDEGCPLSAWGSTRRQIRGFIPPDVRRTPR